METPLLHILAPVRLEGWWYDGAVPENIVAGGNTRIDSSVLWEPALRDKFRWAPYTCLNSASLFADATITIASKMK